jgi:hypothetical protein
LIEGHLSSVDNIKAEVARTAQYDLRKQSKDFEKQLQKAKDDLEHAMNYSFIP